MLASDATISAHSCSLTDDGDGAGGQAGTIYSSSRRASSSRLICEISPSTSRSRREISTRERTASASAAGTYQPSPVRRVVIPKPGGGERLLGVPTEPANCALAQAV